jgi:very-short-patch-repair endonuclease
MKKEERKAIFMFRNKRGIINYNLDLKTFARQNRQNPTRAENKIWQEILNNKKTGYKFSRQRPIDQFILDFYCSKLFLAIEIDGSIHYIKDQSDYDQARSDRLNFAGIKVLRYTNSNIINDIEKTHGDIKKQIKIRKRELGRKGTPPVKGEPEGVKK